MAGAAIVLACLPWSFFASVQTGQTTVIRRLASPSPFSQWLTTLKLEPRVWALGQWYYNVGSLNPTWLEGVDDLSDPERIAARQHLESTFRSRGPAAESDEFFEAAATRRIRASPVRYYLVLPLHRAAQMWLHLEQLTGSGKAYFSPPLRGVVVSSEHVVYELDCSLDIGGLLPMPAWGRWRL